MKAGKVFVVEIFFWGITSSQIKSGRGVRSSHGSVGLESGASFSFRWRISPHLLKFQDCIHHIHHPYHQCAFLIPKVDCPTLQVIYVLGNLIIDTTSSSPQSTVWYPTAFHFPPRSSELERPLLIYAMSDLRLLQWRGSVKWSVDKPQHFHLLCPTSLPATAPHPVHLQSTETAHYCPTSCPLTLNWRGAGLKNFVPQEPLHPPVQYTREDPVRISLWTVSYRWKSKHLKCRLGLTVVSTMYIR